MIALALGSAFFCVTSRALLSVIDRKMFREKKFDLFTGMVWNTIFPFLFAFVFFIFTNRFDSVFLNCLLDRGVFFTGLGAQLAAWAVSYSYRKSRIKNVVFISKSSDLFIPWIGFVFFKKPPAFESCLFSQLTTLALFPLIFESFKTNSIYFGSVVFLLGSLLFQATITHIFDFSEYLLAPSEFLRFCFCALFWRCVVAIFQKLFFSSFLYMKIHLLWVGFSGVNQEQVKDDENLSTVSNSRFLPYEVLKLGSDGISSFLDRGCQEKTRSLEQSTAEDLNSSMNPDCPKGYLGLVDTWNKHPLCIFFIRGGLAFLSQASFFYAITNPSNHLVWPILNTGPLFSCYAAYWLLGEGITTSEKFGFFIFMILSFFYFLRFL